MKADFEEIRESIDVPKNTGVTGFLQTVEGILRLPRVQEIRIDSKGKVDYRYFLREDEEKKPLEMDFDTLQPYAVIRNGVVVELETPHENAAVALGQVFAQMTADQLFPVAFVGGAASTFWQWYTASTGIELRTQDDLYGVPFLKERMLEDYMLVLCAAYTRHSALIDTQRSYKIVIPQVKT